MRLPLLILHISGGVLGLLAGSAAMVFRKGADRHRLAGNVFVVSMLTMGATGSFLALLKHQMNNVFGGMFACYLVGTAWMTGRRQDDGTSTCDWGALLVGLAVATAILSYGVAVAISPTPPADGIPAGMYFFMGSVALLCAMGDLRILVRGGVAGVQRIARHLWRMCFALFIATGSFFLGKQEFFPTWLRGSSVLLLLAVLPLLLLIFWLIRVRFAHVYARMTSSTGISARSLPAH